MTLRGRVFVRRFIVPGTFLTVLITAVMAADKPKDTPKAASSRAKLKEKVTLDYTDMSLREVVEDLKTQIQGLPMRIDAKGGVSGNIKITYSAKDKPLEAVLDGMFKKNGLGYFVLSKQGDSEDGSIFITNRGTERGYRSGEEPDKTAKGKSKDDDKTAMKDKKGKPGGKDKGDAKERKAAKDKADAADKNDDDPDKQEEAATRKLTFAQTLAEDGKTARAKARLEEIIEKYPKTKAAVAAKELLKKLDK
jgi:hypothetical protein